MGLFSTPTNALTGIDSNGKQMTLFEWDFGTYAEMQAAQLFFMTLGYVLLGSLYAPFLTFSLARNFNGSFKIGYLVVFAFAGIFAYEVITGGIMLLMLSMVCSDAVIAFIFGANLGAIAVCLFLGLLGIPIKAFLDKPFEDMTEDDIRTMDAKEQQEVASRFLPRCILIIILIAIMAVLGYVVGTKFVHGDNWVNQKLKLEQWEKTR